MNIFFSCKSTSPFFLNCPLFLKVERNRGRKPLLKKNLHECMVKAARSEFDPHIFLTPISPQFVIPWILTVSTCVSFYWKKFKLFQILWFKSLCMKKGMYVCNHKKVLHVFCFSFAMSFQPRLQYKKGKYVSTKLLFCVLESFDFLWPTFFAHM